MTPQELAQKAHLSDRLIKNIEADPQYNIKGNTARAIAAALGLPVFMIFLPEEHEIINGMILMMLRRQESIFNLNTMFNMLQSIPPHLVRRSAHAGGSHPSEAAHGTQSYSPVASPSNGAPIPSTKG